MTIERRDNGDTPFGNWIRTRRELDSRDGYDLEDYDRIHSRLYTWHQFIHGELMLIEEKEYNRCQSFAQFDTMSVLSQALRQGFSDPSLRLKRKNPIRPTKIIYFGYHLIQFEKTCPKDGGILIGGIRVTEQELLCFLQFDRRFMEERLHFKPQMIPISEQYCASVTHKRRSRKDDIRLYNGATLYDQTPMQQQDLWKVGA